MNIETTMSIFTRSSAEVAEKMMTIKKSTNTYYPDHEESKPHSTLYFSRFDEEKYSELIEKLKKIDLKPFEVKIGKLRFIELPKRNSTFIALDFEDETKFRELHEKVLNIANPLRGGLIRHKDVERHESGQMSEEGWEATQRYGFQYFMENYKPHLTIGTIDIGDKEKEETLKREFNEFIGKTFMVDRIYVKFSRRTIPDQTKIFDSENTEIILK